MKEQINKLLRLNLEIEGALRVIIAHDSPEAMELLIDKCSQFEALACQLRKSVPDGLQITEQEVPVAESGAPESVVTQISEAIKVEETRIPDTIMSDKDNCFEYYELDVPDLDETQAFIPEPELQEPVTNVIIPEPELPEPETNVIIPEPELQEPETNVIIPEPELLEPETEVIIPEPEVPEPETEVIIPETEVPEPETEVIIPEPELSEPADVPNNPEPPVTIADALGSSPRLEDVLAKKTTHDLSKAFTINDKFRFIRGLFCEDKNDFDYTVAHLSDLQSLDEAYDFLLNELGWDIENDEVKDFMQIVNNHFNAR